jgi:hypothetical protein
LAQPLTQITAWSYSRFQTYSECPFKAKCSILLKIKEPQNEARARGEAVHKIAQAYVEAPKVPTLAQLPGPEKVKEEFSKMLNTFKKDFAELRKQKATCEHQWAFTKDWKSTSWFGSDAWLRIMCDAVYLTAKKLGKGLVENKLTIIDHKTGKQREEHEKQRSLYALGGFLLYPDVTEIKAEHLYLDSGERQPTTYVRADLPDLQKEWLNKTKAMLADKRFPPKPGYYCGYCFYSKAKNGPCLL